MKIGLCASAEHAAAARAAGCEYIELNFTTVARMGEGEFAQTVAALEAAGLRSEAMNCFIPGGFNLYALEDGAEREAYMRAGMARAKALGTQVIVFGSSGARRLPEGVEKSEGLQQLLPWFQLAGELAAEAGLTMAIEPLSYTEDNAVNTLREGLALMHQVDLPGLRLLADMYHMGENGEDYGGILQAGADLRHCHIARPAGRKYPLPGDGYDYAPFFDALRQIGYAGRLSIEASPVNGPEDLPACVGYLRSLA
ncbi:MAG: sugar phosphate isomerase/epimerase [Oscillospiraceae bacterium]|jgi:sugar phosphate isomerase/epimerase|nr:sugar phosphate isomerase/epimerase [Oscillospiraceae bacterium]